MIGEMREKIVLQYATKVADTLGGFTSTWTDYATVFAKAWTVSSNEETQAKQQSLIRIQKFKIRYRSVVKTSWRIKWGIRYFNITSIDPDEKREFLFLTCKEAS
jgi:SPP1 family predicted phage head-tail adaptor